MTERGLSNTHRFSLVDRNMATLLITATVRPTREVQRVCDEVKANLADVFKAKVEAVGQNIVITVPVGSQDKARNASRSILAVLRELDPLLQSTREVYSELVTES